MDTIIYVSYAHRNMANVPEYELKEHLFEDYRVLRLKVWEKPPEREERKRRGRMQGFRVDLPIRQLYSRYRQNRARNRFLKQLKADVESGLSPRDENYICYDSGVGKDCFLRSIFSLPEFDGYLQFKWAQQILPKAPGPDFVVLGDGPCLQQVLWELAPYMKSLWWIAPDLAAEAMLEDFAEEFYQETGLAIRLDFLTAGTSFGQLVVPDGAVRKPVNILDFTDEKHIPGFYPPAGSIWLDMSSREEKERRIRARGLSCTFVSLRKQWKNL